MKKLNKGKIKNYLHTINDITKEALSEFTKKEMLMFSRLLVEMHWIKRHIFAKIDLKD